MENRYASRVERLRAIMRQRGWDAVVITGSDPHSSEYPAPRWKCVEWISGFTGEAGDVVVTLDHAGLWTDTRYFIQANRQLEGTGIELHKTRVPEQVLIPEWLSKYYFPDDEVVVAVDGLCQQVSAISEIEEAFASRGEAELRVVSVPDLMNLLWSDRPAIPAMPIISLGADLVGESRLERISWLRESIGQKGCDAILLTALDEIAWVLNVRGSDIDYNPLVISYLLVTAGEVNWYVKKDVFGRYDSDTADTFAEMEDDGVNVLPYDEIDIALAGQTYWERLLVDPSTLNYSLYSTLKAYSQEGALLEAASPVPLRKAVKNAVEIEGMRECHVEDGVAMEKFLYWLETTLRERPVDEWEASEKLTQLRAQIPGYKGDSFETISAYGEGGALPHYVTPRANAPVLQPHGLYLNDSGGQFMNGTTDITRTVPLGPCTMLEKEDYTLVLKAHIDLAMAVWPRGTAGCQLDALARGPLWRAHRNFGHGTGHGVGFFLGVHEGPHDIRQNFNRVPLVPGMITSNEPGIYREGMHGVRHENLYLVVEDGSNEFADWLRFEPLTYCHFDTAGIIRDLLDADEIKWLNAYNQKVYDMIATRLTPEEAEWLQKKCQAI
ncbi:MAG: aminopeptidase P family protein [Bacteroidales bacterium]|nr:aminopeptidase P family protein [Bacteroidales bacterium]